MNGTDAECMEQQESLYWQTVRATLQFVFNEDPAQISSTQQGFRHSSAAERGAIYNMEPLDFVAEFLGVVPTEAQQENYDSIVRSILEVHNKLEPEDRVAEFPGIIPTKQRRKPHQRFHHGFEKDVLADRTGTPLAQIERAKLTDQFALARKVADEIVRDPLLVSLVANSVRREIEAFLVGNALGTLHTPEPNPSVALWSPETVPSAIFGLSGVYQEAASVFIKDSYIPKKVIDIAELQNLLARSRLSGSGPVNPAFAMPLSPVITKKLPEKENK
jgi:hypothetical protein